MKSTRFNFGRALLTLCAIFFVSFSFISCQQEEDDTEYVYEYVLPIQSDSYLAGAEWSDSYTARNTYTSYDSKITPSYIETASYGKQTGTVYYRKLSDTEGYLYYQITDTTNFSYSSQPAASYEGKWYGVYYKELTASSVTMCDACPADYATNYHAFDTLEEAVKGLTLKAGYFSYPTEFTRTDNYQ